MIDLTKDTIRSDLVEDHEKLGVLDPLDPKITAVKGLGKRVTLKDAADKVLADFIIGKEVKDHPDQRYVRVPGQKRTYGVNVKVDLSTRFADWIETNLLKLDASRVRKVVIDHKTLQPRDRSARSPGDVVTIERKDASAPWTVDQRPGGQGGRTPRSSRHDQRPGRPQDRRRPAQARGPDRRPEGGLGRPQADHPPGPAVAGQQGVLSRADRAAVLLSNQGDVVVSTDEGVVYTLRFGEVVFATGNELSAGPRRPEGEGKDEKGKDAKKAEGTSRAATCSSRPPSTPR